MADEIRKYQNAVDIIKTAILQSQARAAKADKDYAGYIMQDFRQPMGVATYKTADEMDPELQKTLPPKEELQRVFVESSKMEK